MKLDNILKTIGLSIKKKRKNLSLTGKDCAEKLKISESQWNKYENGNINLSIGKLHDISSIVGCTFEELLTGSVSTKITNLQKVITEYEHLLYNYYQAIKTISTYRAESGAVYAGHENDIANADDAVSKLEPLIKEIADRVECDKPIDYDLLEKLGTKDNFVDISEVANLKQQLNEVRELNVLLREKNAALESQLLNQGKKLG